MNTLKGGISEVAQTLYDQIPKQVLRKVNARDFVAFEDGIQFKVADWGGFNKIVIKYDEGEDLYNMEFWYINMRDITMRMIDEIKGVYFDRLGEIIQERVLAE